jgi:Domain of unknown function (DUF4091)/Family of unknown function (DUF6067)
MKSLRRWAPGRPGLVSSQPRLMLLAGVMYGLAGCGNSSGAKGGMSSIDGGSQPVGYTSPDGATKGNFGVWTAGSGRKIQPTTAQGTGTSVDLVTYRDAYASAQVIVRATGGDLAGVQAAAADLSDGAGHVIAASNITLFREMFIDFKGVTVEGGNLDVPKNSPTGDTLVPDPLVPLVDPYTGANAGQPFDVQSGSNQPLWLDIHIPKGTPAGTYRGSLTLTASNGSSTTVPVSAKIWPIDLPDMRSVPTLYILGLDTIANYHQGTFSGSTGNCWFSRSTQAELVLKRYEDLAHSHRVELGAASVENAPTNCTGTVDWTAYDSAIAPYLSGAYFSDGVPASRLNMPFSPGHNSGLETSCSQSQYTALAAEYAKHMKANGWFDKGIVYGADEPDPSVFPLIASQSLRMQAGDPDWKTNILDTTDPTADNVGVLNPALGIYAVALGWYDNWNLRQSYGRKEWPGLMAQGIKLWFYESNAQGAPYPTFATNTLDAFEPAIMMWGSWYEHATGFLYWSIDAWDDNAPWGPNTAFGKTGDGVLLYPGNHNGCHAPIGSPAGVAIDGPVGSVRLKMIRQGMQDWSFFQLAEQKGYGDQARTSMSQVYSQMGGCTYDGCPKPAAGFYWKSDESLVAQVRADVAALLTN